MTFFDSNSNQDNTFFDSAEALIGKDASYSEICELADQYKRIEMYYSNPDQFSIQEQCEIQDLEIRLQNQEHGDQDDHPFFNRKPKQAPKEETIKHQARYEACDEQEKHQAFKAGASFVLVG